MGRVELILVALLLASTFVSAQTPLLTEREARAQGRRLLRAGRFEEAIEAFAQSAKCWPASQPEAFDSRSEPLILAFEEKWAELQAPHAQEEERLRFASFFVDHFPFFSFQFEYGAELWCERYLLLADARIRHADPQATDPRFEMCRDLATLQGAKGGERVLALLEKPDWPDPHDDFGACALRAFRLLDLRVSAEEQSRQDALRERAWSAYRRRFSHARCFGWAAQQWYRTEEAESIASDPVAQRWCWGGRAREYADPATQAVIWNRLSELSPRFVSPVLAEVWKLVHHARFHEETAARRKDLLSAWRRTKERHAGTPEFGMASFALLWSDSPNTWHEREGALEEFLREWEAAAPHDPFLPWARWARVNQRLHANAIAVLSDSERLELMGLAARFRLEAIGAFAQLTLAEDEVRRGYGHEARRRYEEIASLDPEGVSLPAAGDPRNAIGGAREKLALYYKRRDPGRAADLSGNPIFSDSPHMPDNFVCGNAVSSRLRLNERLQVSRLALAGRVDEAIERSWHDLSRLDIHGEDAESALAFADLCAAADRRERITQAIHALYALQEAEDRAEPKYPNRSFSEQARRLELYRSVLESAPRMGAAGIARQLAEVLARMRLGALEPPRARETEIDTILRAARHCPRVVAEVPSLLVHPATPIPLLLARLYPTPETLRYALDVTLAATSPGPGAGHSVCDGLATEVLLADPESALSSMLDRVRTDGPALWSGLRPIVGMMPVDVLWAAYRRFRDDPDPRIRDLVRMELEQARRFDPWRVYCLESE